MPEHVYLAGHRQAHDEQLRFVHQRLEPLVRADEPAVGLTEGLVRAVVHQHRVGLVRKLVPGGAVHRPVGPQMLIEREDLFHHEVESALRVVRQAQHLCVFRLQIVQVLARVVEAIHVVDPQPLHRATLDELKGELVRGLEHFRQFHANRRERVDIEKAPVIDLFARHAPVAEAIILRAQERVERLHRLPVARHLHLRHRLADRQAKRLQFFRQRAQPALDDELLARAHRGLVAVARGGGRQMFDRRDDALEFELFLLRDASAHQRVRALEHRLEAARIDRQHRLPIVDGKNAVDELQLEVALIEDSPVLVAEDGEQHLVRELALERAPIDVEIRRVNRRLAVLEHVHPPGVAHIGDAHVVRHHVDDQAQP